MRSKAALERQGARRPAAQIRLAVCPDQRREAGAPTAEREVQERGLDGVEELIELRDERGTSERLYLTAQDPRDAERAR